MAGPTKLVKNPIFIQRMEDYFDSLDLNKNGFLTIDEIQQWATNLQEKCEATPDEVSNLRTNLYQFWGAVGLIPGKEVNKQDFVRGIARLGQAELERQKNNEITLHSKLNNSFFDVMDINSDGTVSLEELRLMMEACNKDPGEAESWMAAVDTNKNGKVEREELNKFEFDFWFKPQDQKTEGLFGGTYEKSPKRARFGFSNLCGCFQWLF